MANDFIGEARASAVQAYLNIINREVKDHFKLWLSEPRDFLSLDVPGPFGHDPGTLRLFKLFVGNLTEEADIAENQWLEQPEYVLGLPHGYGESGVSESKLSWPFCSTRNRESPNFWQWKAVIESDLALLRDMRGLLNWPTISKRECLGRWLKRVVDELRMKDKNDSWT